MKAQPQYEELSDFLLQLQAIVSPAELHGMLCGRLSGGQRLDPKEWLDAAIGYMDLIDTAVDSASAERIKALYDEALTNLQDLNRPLKLLLPPDEVSLSHRLESMSGWCEGFLHGLGLSGLSGASEMPADATEALRDLAQIAQANLDEEDENMEEQEQYYTELVEYVRVAVLTLFTELNPPTPQIH